MHTESYNNLNPTVPSYAEGLNPMQMHAVMTTEGGVLVLAGAGTGKTKALTARIAHIIATKRAYPSEVLAVTFTNKAAREITHRVEALLHPEGIAEGTKGRTAGMWLGTFHSIAARILRRDGASIGFDSNFTILDADDQLRLLKSLMVDLGIDGKKFAPKMMMGIIQSWKDQALPPHSVTQESLTSDYTRKAFSLYEVYQKRLKALNAMDFGDLLLHNLTVFQRFPDIAQHYAHKFRYILVDEYQDTNIAQYVWLRLLALGHHNICCVGDDDQSIYGWRGAEVGNILKFEQDFPNSTVIRLEQNYRSTQHILGAASALIAHNEARHKKTLWTERDGGEQIRVCSLYDDGEEARFVGEEIEAAQREGISLNHIAILVRAGFQTRAFEERFLTAAIPYRIIGGLRFYERLEIRDAIAYMRVVIEPRDDLAFERIMNTPKRGIGKSTVETLYHTAREQNISLFEASRILCRNHIIKGKAGQQLAYLIGQRDGWFEQSKNLTPAALCELILEESGYMEMWRVEASVEANGRLENIKELFRALQDFSTLTDFIEHVGLVMEREVAADDQMVSVMSLHSAKGLEFDVVFCTGWEEGLFPHQRALDEQGGVGLEEERRLAYVGITRAKRRLYISHASRRRMYNQWQDCVPSRFLQELPIEHIESHDQHSGRHQQRATSPSLFQRGIDKVFQENVRAPAPAKSAYARVFHPSFGYGKVMGQSGDHLDIIFEGAGRKKLKADYVSMVE
ncbi:MAG: DNA helicase II [Alphaproteobacteria bacterium]|nr:MAG: DNA helicase II [Alphaproteobacteria bacterium]TAF14175.1 MAG: DNA helicase II [Alphaproteobacteria bacterium]TAF74951.1 MAG: DNA helicase II [Alphaproteobacteria bacterium]